MVRYSEGSELIVLDRPIDRLREGSSLLLHAGGEVVGEFFEVPVNALVASPVMVLTFLRAEIHLRPEPPLQRLRGIPQRRRLRPEALLILHVFRVKLIHVALCSFLALPMLAVHPLSV